MRNNIAEIRKKRGFTRKALVDVTETSSRSLGKIRSWRLTSLEKDRGWPPTPEEMTTLAAVLDTAIEEIFPDFISPSPSPPPEGSE